MTTFKTYTPDTRKPKSNEEDLLQATCFDYWNKHFRKTSLLFSVPNGQERNYAEAAIAIATGLTAGVADLILLLPGGRTIFFELKTAKGTQKKGQKVFEANVKRLSFPYYLIRTFEQFKQHLIALLGPPNEEANHEPGKEGCRPGNPKTKESQARIAAQETNPNGRRNEAVSSGVGRRRSL